jgi:hypothetical protein
VSAFLSPPDSARVIQKLDARISALETMQAVIPVGSGGPATNPIDGAQYGDTAGSFYYLRLGGAWRKVAVA